jgi:hypothetical protein
VRALDLIGLIALLAGMPALVLFVIFYAARSKWRKYPVGRALMYLASSLSLTYLWVAVRLGLALSGHLQQPDTLPWQLIRIVLFGAVSIAAWRLLFVLLRTQARDGWSIDEPVLVPEEE